MDDELDKILKEKFTNNLRYGYDIFKGTTMPISFKNYEKEIENFEIRNDDVWLSSFPKSGTTWSMEMVWLVANDLNYEKAKINLNDRFPFIEMGSILDFNTFKERKGIDYIPIDCIANSLKLTKELKGRRFIKTHLPWELLPLQIQNNTKKPKIIYVMRSPKDVVVSFYHHCKLIEGYTGNLEEFVKLFLADKLNYTPYWNNLKSFWDRRHQSNVLILTYEEMKKNLPNVIRKTSTFFEKSYTDEQIDKLANHLSFESMKKNPAVNFDVLMKEIEKCYDRTETVGEFMRSGTVGSYKKDLTDEMIEEIDKWTIKHNSGTGITF